MTPECILTQPRASSATLVDIFLQVMEALTTGKASLMDDVILHINDTLDKLLAHPATNLTILKWVLWNGTSFLYNQNLKRE